MNHKCRRSDFYDFTRSTVKKNKYLLKGIIDFEQSIIGNIFQDFIFMYIDFMMEKKDLEKCFFDGYGICIGEKERKLAAYFILQFAIELCGILRNVNIENYKLGTNIIDKVFKWLN